MCFSLVKHYKSEILYQSTLARIHPNIEITHEATTNLLGSLLGLLSTSKPRLC